MLRERVTSIADTSADERTKFLWFSGKGGTGKTTISAATALQLADRGHETLLISTDPAHSLSDSLDMDIDGKTAVKDTLDALELDPEEEVDSFQEQLQMADLDDQMGMMDDVYEGIDIMKGGPGVTEMAAFNTFIEYMHKDEYDVIVFDTAPTGHTLSLLRLPEVLDSMVGKVLKMRMRFSAAVDTFKTMLGQEPGEDAEIEQLEAMKSRIESARELMTDPTVTSFNFVMLAEKMSIYETERAVEHVNEFDIPIGRLFVNQLLPENEDCEFCTSRHEMQQDNLDTIHSLFADHDIVEIPQFPHEVRGEDVLNRLAENMEIATPSKPDG